MSKNEKYSDKYKKTPKDLPKSKGNRDVISKLLQPVNKDNHNTVNTEIQRNVNEDKQTTGNAEIQQSVNKDKQLPVNEKEKSVKKATFELDSDLHMNLKIYAASKDKKMVEVVEEALTSFLQQNQE